MRQVDLGITAESVVMEAANLDATSLCWVRAGVVAGTEAASVATELRSLIQRMDRLVALYGPTDALVQAVERQLIEIDMPVSVYEVEIRLTIRAKLYTFWAFPEA